MSPSYSCAKNILYVGMLFLCYRIVAGCFAWPVWQLVMSMPVALGEGMFGAVFIRHFTGCSGVIRPERTSQQEPDTKNRAATGCCCPVLCCGQKPVDLDLADLWGGGRLNQFAQCGCVEIFKLVKRPLFDLGWPLGIGNQCAANRYQIKLVAFHTFDQAIQA